MDFLKTLFGEKALTFEELKAAIEANDKIKIANLKDGGYVAKDKFDTETAKAKKAQEDLDAANVAIEKFKGMDVEGIKAAADKYKADFDAAQITHKADMEKLQFGFALDNALKTAKAKNTKAVKALLSVEGLKLDGETIIGLKDQLDKVVTEAPYLFDIEEKEAEGAAVQIVKGGGAPNGSVKNPWLKESLNYTEQGRLLRDDPLKAKAYMAQAGK